MNDPNLLCLVTGGSGGHILPALLLSKKWLKDNPQGKVVFFCSSKKLDKNIVSESKFLYKTIHLNLINIPGLKFWLYPKFLFQLTKTFCKSFYHLFKLRPHKIISTGGFLSVPVCLMGKMLKSKIDIHELNVVPGKAIKFLISVADKVVITFEASKIFFKNKFVHCAHKCVLQDYPIRFEQQDKIFDKGKIIENINNKMWQSKSCFFEKSVKTIFLLGGSQGSLFLNKIFKDWISRNKVTISPIQVIHQTGLKDTTDWVSFYKKLDIAALVFSYNSNIKDYYLISDLVISRAGAGTLFELEFFKKRSLIIPLKTVQTDHQVDNALQMSQKNPDLFFVQDQDKISKNFSLFDREMLKRLSL